MTCCLFRENLINTSFSYVQRALEERDNGDRERRVFDLLEKRRKTHPSQFEMWKMPAAWDRGLDFATNLDVIMHLCFLGSTHTLTDVIRKYLKRKGKHSKFLSGVSGRLEGIESLKLVNFKAHGFTLKNGSWVSEQWVALAKVMKWFFSDVSQFGKDQEYQDPVDPDYTKWRSMECKDWLSQRGLDTKGHAHDLKQRVAEYMQQDGGPPDILEKMSVGDGDVLRLVEAHAAMIAHIMSKEVTEPLVRETEVCIKVRWSCSLCFAWCSCTHQCLLCMPKRFSLLCSTVLRELSMTGRMARATTRSPVSSRHTTCPLSSMCRMQCAGMGLWSIFGRGRTWAKGFCILSSPR